MNTAAQSPAQGGLEGCTPSKNHYFLVLVAGFAGNEHQKIEISGRLRLPEPLHRAKKKAGVAPGENSRMLPQPIKRTQVKCAIWLARPQPLSAPHPHSTARFADRSARARSAARPGLPRTSCRRAA